MTVRLFLIDNSALARVHQPTVRDRLVALAADGELACAAPQALEILYSARNAGEWEATRQALAEFTALPASAASDQAARDLQEALLRAGKLRAVGPTDLLIAGIAATHGATVVHYDADYEHVASVDESFRQAWVVPRGTVP